MANASNETNIFEAVFVPTNHSEEIPEDILLNRDPLYVVIPITILYVLIFISGIIGNISTCVVVARNRHMHTATNYYLFSLAVSDLLLLLSGLPSETFVLWSKHKYPFTEEFCFLGGFAAETSANATVLTITAFTVERYVAICHPFRSHNLSKLSRALSLIFVIWVSAMLLAIPPAIQYGVIHTIMYEVHSVSYCSIKLLLFDNAFLVSTCVIFVLPFIVITVLYALIGLKLRVSVRMTVKRPSVSSDGETSRINSPSNQRHVIKMLVAVVAAFFICWAPFHAQRLWAMHLQSNPNVHPLVIILYNILKHISGILYFLSTTVNPVLYNIMSRKYRLAFKSTLSRRCGKTTPPERKSPHGTIQKRNVTPQPSFHNHCDSVVILKSLNSRQTRIFRSSSHSQSSSSEGKTSWEGNNNNCVNLPKSQGKRIIEEDQQDKLSDLNAKPHVTRLSKKAIRLNSRDKTTGKGKDFGK